MLIVAVPLMVMLVERIDALLVLSGPVQKVLSSQIEASRGCCCR
jgi:hypothetical protein